jgi:hypothetical protein
MDVYGRLAVILRGMGLSGMDCVRFEISRGDCAPPKNQEGKSRDPKRELRKTEESTGNYPRPQQDESGTKRPTGQTDCHHDCTDTDRIMANWCHSPTGVKKKKNNDVILVKANSKVEKNPVPQRRTLHRIQLSTALFLACRSQSRPPRHSSQ